jgi:hypothetical protein
MSKISKLLQEEDMIASKLTKFVKQTTRAKKLDKLPPSIEHLIKMSHLSDQNNT